jgi:Domain of unknown function (DUF1707)
VSGSGEARALRVSDFDREQAVTDLKHHAAAGRLTVEELAERVDAAYRAETFGDLADLMSDLPTVVDRGPVVRPAGGRRRRRPFWPGVAPFTEIVEIGLPPGEVRRRLLEHLAQPLAKYGYELVEASDERISFVMSGRTGPFSLPRRLSIRLSLEPLGEGRTRLLAHGSGPLSVRRGFAGLARI